MTIVLKNAVNLLNTWMARWLDGVVAHRLRERIFEQTLSSCLDYRTSVKRADIATTLSTNSWRVTAALTLIGRMAIALITFIVFIAIMAALSVPLTLISLGFVALAAATVRVATRQADAIGQAVVEENKRFGLRMWESMNALQLIRAFGRESYERQRFVTASETVRKRLLALDFLWAVPGTISEVAITLLVGALVLTAHVFGVGVAALAAFLSLLYRLQGPTRDLMQCKVAFDGMAPAVEDV